MDPATSGQLGAYISNCFKPNNYICTQLVYFFNLLYCSVYAELLT